MWLTVLTLQTVFTAAVGGAPPIELGVTQDGRAGETVSLDQAEVARRAAQASTAGLKEDALGVAAEAQKSSLQQRFYPRVDVTARYTRIGEEDPSVIAPAPGIAITLDGPKPDQFAIGLGVQLPVTDWFLRWSLVSRAGDAGIAAAKAKAEVARRAAMLSAVLAYWDLVRVHAVQGVAAQSVADAEARRADTEKRVKALVASSADLRLAEARIAETHLAELELRHTQSLLETQLTVLLGLPRNAAMTITRPTDSGPGAEASQTAESLVLDLDALLAEAWRNRPEAKALSAAESALESERRLAAVKRYPRLDLIANTQFVDPNSRVLIQEDGLVFTWDVSAVISWNVNGLWEAGAAQDDVDGRRMAVDADRRALDDGIRQEVAFALRTIADAESRRAAAHVMLRAAEEGHRVRSKLYAIGQSTSIEVAEAETQLERARLAIVDAAITRRVGDARLAYATGRAL